MTKNICIIPARMGSSRFPGKPMQEILGKPMIEHVLSGRNATVFAYGPPRLAAAPLRPK